MIKNVDGTYIYLVVPAKYECVYTKLLVKMSDLGVDLLKDCASTCRGLNRQVLNCWNMFQAACCAYEVGEYKKADLLINYVNASLNFACTDKQSPAISNFKVNVVNLKGNQRIEISQATFVIDNIDAAKPDSLFIYYKNTNTVLQANKPLTSPLDFDESQMLDVEVGKTYTWYATIEDSDGNVYKSNEYTVAVAEDDKPSISSFVLNIPTTVTGAQTVTYDKATFAIGNKSKTKPNSLTIYQVEAGGDIALQENLSIDSPVTFATLSIAMAEGKQYKWRAKIEGNDGTSYYSNIYTVNCVAPPKELTMYWGPATVNGSAGAVAFKSKTATELMSLPGRQSKKIVGNSAQTFTINQTENVHWLLIPDGMTLVHAEYGDVLVSVLWDNGTKKGAYKEPFDAGEYDGIHYTMFFLYNPSGGFSEDIRITCKND
nr:MAG: hypothetical protein [Bacteriophage sp.]